MFKIDTDVASLAALEHAFHPSLKNSGAIFEPHGSYYGFALYTFKPILTASFPGTDLLPSEDAMTMDFPDVEGPNSFERSTLMVKILPSINISTFFMISRP